MHIIIFIEEMSEKRQKRKIPNVTGKMDEGKGSCPE